MQLLQTLVMRPDAKLELYVDQERVALIALDPATPHATALYGSVGNRFFAASANDVRQRVDGCRRSRKVGYVQLIETKARTDEGKKKKKQIDFGRRKEDDRMCKRDGESGI